MSRMRKTAVPSAAPVPIAPRKAYAQTHQQLQQQILQLQTQAPWVGDGDGGLGPPWVGESFENMGGLPLKTWVMFGFYSSTMLNGKACCERWTSQLCRRMQTYNLTLPLALLHAWH